eukprot:69331_1
MSFMLTYYSSFNRFFEDKTIIKSLMIEANDASVGWQNILVDIIRNDDEIKELYQPNVKKYQYSERLNLLNLEMHGKKLCFSRAVNWLKQAVENDHYKVFKILLEEHCENKMTGFKQIFYYYVQYNTICNKYNLMEIMGNKINCFKTTLNKTQRKKFDILCIEWKSKNDNKKTRSYT